MNRPQISTRHHAQNSPLLLDDLDITQLIVTHDLLYANEVCDRAVILDKGRVVADDDIGAILRDAELLAKHRLGLPKGVKI